MKKNNWKKFNLLKLFALQRFTYQAIVGLAITTLVGFNFIISPLAWRLDFSQGKAYTLSASTNKILHQLDDIVNIKFYVSTGLPTRLLPLKTEVTDLLNEYQKNSNGKVAVKLIDPKKDDKALAEAQETGIPELQFSQLEQDKYAVSTAFFGIGISYGDKREVIPQVTEVESLEYNLTSAIYKITRKELVKIGIFGYEEGSNQAQDPVSTFKKVAGQQFDVESVAPPFNTDIKALIIFDTAAKKYTDEETATIKTYLDHGGKAIVFADGITVDANLTAKPAEHNLFGTLANYGIDLTKDLVLSGSSEIVNFGNSAVQFFSPYPFWVKTTVFNDKTPYFSNIRQLTFPWVSSLSLNKRNGWEAVALIKTSAKSWDQQDNFTLDPQNIPQPQALKSYTVAAETKNNSGGDLITIASSRFILDQYLSQTADNLEFLLNVLNNLAANGALSGIRARAVSFYPLPELPTSQKDAFKYGNILTLPILFSLYGVYRLLKRK